jgi:tRNA(fMet)-specific endonuclease VapC
LLLVAIVPFDADCAERFAAVAAELTTRGQPIGMLDTLVASQALTLGLIVVTNNIRHFSQVQALKIENWR